MSIPELIDLMIAIADARTPLAELFCSWGEIREAINAEHRNAASEADRVTCLRLRNNLLDYVERTLVRPEDLEEFGEVRRKEYELMLMREAMIGRTDGRLDPHIMLAITTREIRDGRMPFDYGLHTLALAHMPPATSQVVDAGMAGIRMRRVYQWLGSFLRWWPFRS